MIGKPAISDRGKAEAARRRAELMPIAERLRKAVQELRRHEDLLLEGGEYVAELAGQLERAEREYALALAAFRELRAEHRGAGGVSESPVRLAA